jgi:hypothetical protein
VFVSTLAADAGFNPLRGKARDSAPLTIRTATTAAGKLTASQRTELEGPVNITDLTSDRANPWVIQGRAAALLLGGLDPVPNLSPTRTRSVLPQAASRSAHDNEA